MGTGSKVVNLGEKRATGRPREFGVVILNFLCIINDN